MDGLWVCRGDDGFVGQVLVGTMGILPFGVVQLEDCPLEARLILVGVVVVYVPCSVFAPGHVGLVSAIQLYLPQGSGVPFLGPLDLLFLGPFLLPLAAQF